MRHLPAAVVVLAVALGVAGFVYGETDDSPGLQLLSALFVIGAVAVAVRLSRRTR
ncbi:hypothetical protein [Micromonospora robiginosa]|uniref:Uncharacterized protein n=1 Tax=Micromonospora robiginosa TaxID=2749844 RepID=A0A7L6B2U7_9ACTN|nr:hypothetical protein [Micromonospora ferruginea]QLQ36095.1 hypothetical protein H1D33_22550 [Micromonospora ferruginea]